jgi:hypothetical protein
MHKRFNEHRRRQRFRARSSRAFGSASRRLRLEGMEGRLMLSTSGDADFMPLNLNVAQISLDPIGSPPGATFTSSDAAGYQGGFIEPPSSSGFISTDSTFDIPLTPIPREVEPDVDPQFPTIPTRSDTDLLVPLTPADPALDIQENAGLPLDSNLDTGADVLISGPVEFGFELQPSVIPIWDVLPQAPILDSSVTRIRQVDSLAEEGGLIHIDSMLSSMALIDGPELSDIAADPPSENDSEEAEDSEDLIRLAATETSDGGSISGELARAMTFEMAGGEPDDTEPAARGAQNDGSQTTDGNPPPISRESVSAVGRRTSHVIENVSADAARGQMAAASMSPVVVTLGGMLAGLPPTAQPVFERNLGWTPVSTITPGGSVPGAEAALDLAHMEAFDELADESATRSSIGLEFSLRGALNATPLLMILALERIAASNSRRANRDERTPTALPLRRAAKGPDA